MSRYINAKDALEIIDRYDAIVVGDEAHVVVLAVRDIVSTICPVADVQEVKHGHFEINPNRNTCEIYRCNLCGAVNCEKSNYCQRCGAKMDEEEEKDADKELHNEG